MNTHAEIDRLHETAVRRMEIARQSLVEYKEAVDELLEEAQAEAMSQKLTVTDMAKLLEKSRPTIYRMGAADCKTYADLWRWVKANRPKLLKTLERNYTTWTKSKLAGT